MNINRVIYIWIDIIIIILGCIVNGINNENVFFYFDVFLAVLIIAIATFSIISIIAIVEIYPLISIMVQYNSGQSYGLLQLASNSGMVALHYLEFGKIIMLGLITMLVFISSTNFLENEKTVFSRKIIVPISASKFISVVSVISVIIAFPKLPFIGYNSATRFQALLPGNAWNHLAIAAMLIAIVTHFDDSFLIKFNSFFVCFWFLSHYERVDISSFILGIVVIIVRRKKINVTFKQFTRVFLLLIFLIVILVFLGDVRQGVKSFSIPEISKEIFVQKTATDIAYVFNISIDYALKYSLLLGKTYLTYFQEVIPLLHAKDAISSILSSCYPDPGGIFIFSEPFMNFSYAGVIGESVILLTILNCICKFKNMYSTFLYMFITTTVIRLLWYGLSFGFMAIFYFLPLLVLIITIFKKYSIENRVKLL